MVSKLVRFAPLALICFVSTGTPAYSAQVSRSPLAGIWLGKLKVPGAELRMAITISGEEGALTATLKSIDQGSPEIPLEEVRYEAPTLFLGLKPAGIQIEGQVDLENEKIECEFRQGGGKFPLLLERVDEIPEISRPQEPSSPYPYNEEEVEYENLAAGVKLSATLTFPKEGGPFPAVILLTGSGPQNRNEEVFGHKPFLVLSDYLTRQGIAVLRADDRGVGGSTGDFKTATTEDFAGDGLAGVDFLKGRDEVDSKRIGLIGHSEGAMMAPIAASRSSDVAFIVMLAGPGTGFDEIVLFQRAQAMRRAGASPENASLTRSWYRSLYGVSASTLDHESAEKRIRQLSAELDEDVKKKVGWNEERLEKELPGLLRPWWRFANAYDPIATLMRVQCPVLALNGEKDMQVPGTENAAAIERALKLGGNPSFEVKVMPGLNHLLQTAETGSELEYTKIDETISPTALQAISAWVLAVTNGLTD